MRRRWKALVAVGAVALVAGLIFLLPPRDDGLDWIRKYEGKETRRESTSPTGLSSIEITFQFDQIPKPLLDTLDRKRRDSVLMKQGQTGADWGFAWSTRRQVVTAWRYESPS